MTDRAHVAIATATRGLEFDQDLDSTLGALNEHGFEATAARWDDQTVDWSSFALVVVRSTWDYPERRGEFLSWARSLHRVANPADILEWNTDKHYLADLDAVGVPTVPTIWIDGPTDLGCDFPEGDIVVKPTVGAGGIGSARFGPGEREEIFDHLTALLDRGATAMVQPYLDAIERDGERSLIYLGREFSHAIYKPPLLGARGPFLPGSLTVDIIEPTKPTDADLEFAASALAAVPGGAERLLYAGVDIAASDDGHRCS